MEPASSSATFEGDELRSHESVDPGMQHDADLANEHEALRRERQRCDDERNAERTREDDERNAERKLEDDERNAERRREDDDYEAKLVTALANKQNADFLMWLAERTARLRQPASCARS